MPTLMNCPQIFEFIKSKYSNSVLFRRILFGIAGATLGLSYYHFIGCYNGTCAITSNPYISTAYGAVVGLVLTPSKKKADQ